MKLSFPLLALTLLAPWRLPAGEWKLTVEAGDHDRRQVLVPFQAPANVRGNFTLRGGGGTAQVDATGRGVFLLPELAKGEKKTFALESPCEAVNQVHTQIEGDVLKLTVSGKPIFQYQTKPGPVPPEVPEQFRHGAHLHPVFTPAGKIVTGNHPADHRWHRGIWFAWTDTDFEGRHPDFWNMAKEKSGALTGEVRFASLERYWGGPVQGGFVSQHRFLDHTSGTEKEVLAETWEVIAAALPGANVIDFISTQTTAGPTPLKLPKYHYGGLGVRGNGAWDPQDAVTMLTSNGDDRLKGDSSKGKWVFLGGQLEGQPAGLVVLIHPDNFRFPQPLRLNPKNPQLCVAPSQDGNWAIEPGKPYVSRYRFLAVDGPANAEAFERAWVDYAHPPRVTLTEKP